MAYSRLVTPADGVTTVYAVNFPLGYLSIADVKGYVTGEVSETGEQLYRTLTWLTTGTVDIGLPGAVGSDVVIERTVDKTDLVHNFVDGDILTEQSLDESFMQSMMAVHEVLDGRFSALGAHLDMNGFRVQNLGDPVDDGDAVSLSWFRENSGTINLDAAQAAQEAAEAAESVSVAARDVAVESRDVAVAAKDATLAALDQANLGPATTEAAGVSRQATIAEAESGVSTTPAALPHVTPEGVAAALSAARASLGVVEAPVGSYVFMGLRETHVVPGCLLCNGAAVTATYPDLRALLIADGSPYGADGSGNPLLPNWGGYHLRGWLPGQVIDSARAFGVVQQDAMQGHKHRTPLGASGTGDAWVQPDGVEGTQTVAGGIASVGTWYRPLTGNASYSDGTHGTPRIASETRGHNQTVIVWIKAYPAAVDTGSIDLAQLTVDINGVEVRTTALETVGPPKLSTASGGAPSYSARAAVSFNGITGALNSAKNVSSVTVQATGTYAVNFATALPNADYCWVASLAAVQLDSAFWAGRAGSDTKTNSTIVLRCRYANGGGSNYVNADETCVAVF